MSNQRSSRTPFEESASTDKAIPAAPVVGPDGSVQPGKTGTTAKGKGRGKNSGNKENNPPPNPPAPTAPTASLDIQQLLKSTLLELGLIPAPTATGDTQLVSTEPIQSTSKATGQPPAPLPSPEKHLDVLSDEEDEVREFAVDEEAINAIFESDDEKEDDWLADFATEYGPKEETGPPLPKQLAEVIDGMMKNMISEVRGKELLDKYIRPANIVSLLNPRVNSQVWQRLKEMTKKSDLRLGHIGDKLIKMILANVSMVLALTTLKDQVLGQTRKAVKDIARSGLDAIQLGAVTMHELSAKA